MNDATPAIPPQPSSPAHGSRLAPLDALRGIAAIGVLLYHYSLGFHRIFPGASSVPWNFWLGQQGVALFFAMSGFVICMTLDRTTDLKSFAVARFVRLYPAYWAAMACTVVITLAAGVHKLIREPGVILANLTMLNSFMAIGNLDWSYWTLPVELCFYLCMALIWRAGLIRHVDYALWPWLALKWLWWAVPGLPGLLALVLVVKFVPLFGIGIMLYRVQSGAYRWARALPFVAAALFSIWWIEGGFAFSVAAGVTLILIAMIFGWLGWIAQRPLVWLGSISYALYLVHQSIGYIVMLKLGAIGTPPHLAFALAAAVSIALGAAVTFGVEQPALRLHRGRRAKLATFSGP